LGTLNSGRQQPEINSIYTLAYAFSLTFMYHIVPIVGSVKTITTFLFISTAYAARCVHNVTPSSM